MSEVSTDVMSDPGTTRAETSLAPGIFGLGAVFLIVALAVGFVAATKLVFPEFLGGVEFLGYGRLAPLADASLLTGWLAVAGVAVAFHVVGREADGGIAGGRAAWLGPLLIAGGTAAGMVGLALGKSSGVEHFAGVWWSDVIVSAGMLVSLAVVFRTAARIEPETASPPVWFGVGGVTWMLFAFVVGSLPEIAGVNVALQTWFAYSGLLFGGLLALGVAAAYYVISDVGGDERGGSLSYIGFWSLMFVSGWLGPRFLTHSPLPEWLETVGVLFALVLFVPVWTILTDLADAGKDKWQAMAAHTSVRFVVAGGALFAFVPIQGVLHAFRSSSSVVQFTLWDSAWDYLLAGGAITMWLLAFCYRVVPALASRDRAATGRTHFHLSVLGLGTVLVALWAGGLQQGYGWSGIVNSGEVANLGRGFRNSVSPLEGWFGLWSIGAGVYALAQLFLLAGMVRRAGPAGAEVADPAELPDDEPAEEFESRPIATRLLIRGVLGLAALGAVATFLVPALEADHRKATVLGESRSLPADSIEAEGREVYIQEGCMYCHTQQVRPVIADVGLGAVSFPGDYSEESPALLGSSRIGPDLMHAGASGRESASAAWTVDFLKDPKAERPWSIQPSYDHLTDAELNALAIYIAGLK